MSDRVVIEVSPDRPIEVFAAFVGERLAVRERPERIASGPPMFTIGQDQVMVLFRYGVAVLFNVATERRAEVLAELEPTITGKFAEPEIEHTHLVLDRGRPEGPHGPAINLASLSVGRLQAVAEIMAKSVVLAHYEQELAAVFEVIEPLASEMGRAGKLSTRSAGLIKHIGKTLTIQHSMVGRVEVPEKPDFLWENPELDRLYLRLEDEFELRERHLALERKLSLIANTAETLLELLQARRTLRVEWYIVGLIGVEIAFYLWELFLRQ